MVLPTPPIPYIWWIKNRQVQTVGLDGLKNASWCTKFNQLSIRVAIDLTCHLMPSGVKNPDKATCNLFWINGSADQLEFEYISLCGYITWWFQLTSPCWNSLIKQPIVLVWVSFIQGCWAFWCWHLFHFSGRDCHPHPRLKQLMPLHQAIHQRPIQSCPCLCVFLFFFSGKANPICHCYVQIWNSEPDVSTTLLQPYHIKVGAMPPRHSLHFTWLLFMEVQPTLNECKAVDSIAMILFPFHPSLSSRV